MEDSFRLDSYNKLKQQYEAGEIYYEDENTGKITYESHPNYFSDTFTSLRGPHPKGFQMVVVYFKAFLFTLLGAMPYVIAVWVIYFTIRFIVMGFIGKNENT